jgi:hypothetical protein
LGAPVYSQARLSCPPCFACDNAWRYKAENMLNGDDGPGNAPFNASD